MKFSLFVSFFYFLFSSYSGELVLARLRRDDHFGARFVIWCVVLKILCMQLERCFFKLTSHISPSTFFFFCLILLGWNFPKDSLNHKSRQKHVVEVNAASEISQKAIFDLDWDGEP